MDVPLLLVLFFLALLGLVFSSIEKSIIATNQFLFKQAYNSDSFFVKHAHDVMNTSSDSLKVCWFGKTISLILVSSLLTLFFDELDIYFFSALTLTIGLLKIIPKVLSELFPELIIIYSSPVLLIFKPMLRFFISGTTSIGKWFSFILGSDKNLGTFFIKHDLREIISQNKRRGLELEKDVEIISNLFEVRKVTAKEVMIPRKDIIAVSKQSSIKDVREKFKQVLHSRVIVYDKTIDTIIGYIDLGDIFASSQRITDMVKPVFFVPESRKLFDIFQDFFRHKDTHIAVVVDEYGGTTGIISVTDLTEEIIGDFKIDSGVRGRKKTQPEWLQQDATTFVVNGKLKTEVFRDVSFIDITGESYETVAGFVLDHLQRIPETGESFHYDDMIVTILSATKNHIESIKFDTKEIIQKN